MNKLIRCWLALCPALVAAAALSAQGANVPVFVFAGQSNAVGITNLSELSSTQKAPQSSVLFYGPNEAGNTWGTFTPSFNSPPTPNSPNFDLGGFGPEISTGKTISAALGGQLVAEVKYAVGGTNLFNQWNPAGTNNLYDNMVSRVNQSLADMQTQRGDTGYVAGFFWMQGESDAGRNDYAANLTNFIAAVRAEFDDPNLPFVFGQIIDYDPPNSTSLRAQQQTVANTVANTKFVLTDDLGHNDFIHFSGQGIYTMGERFGAGYMTLVPEPGSAMLLGGAAAVSLMARRRWRPVPSQAVGMRLRSKSR